jgi:phosphate transport system substrate-binding protein
MRKVICISVLISLLFLNSCAPQSSSTTNPHIKSASAYIQNKGSDTLVNLALSWAEHYQSLHPEIEISVTGGGTGTGFTSLINETVDIANASRQIKAEEVQQAKDKGFDPVEFTVANDAIAVIVNPGNPVSQLTLDQVSRIYQGLINNWQEVGGEARPIVRLSRETNSGTHVYFLETVIRLGDAKNKFFFSADTLLLPSSEGIISEVRDNPNAIGYDGLGYVTPEVKMIALAKKVSDTFVIPSAATVTDKSYPISRSLYMYTHGQPSGAIKDYLDWIKSAEAQKFTIQLGFVPLAATQ